MSISGSIEALAITSATVDHIVERQEALADALSAALIEAEGLTPIDPALAPRVASLIVALMIQRAAVGCYLPELPVDATAILRQIGPEGVAAACARAFAHEASPMVANAWCKVITYS